jgi:hypothetical protein
VNAKSRIVWTVPWTALLFLGWRFGIVALWWHVAILVVIASGNFVIGRATRQRR